MKIDGQLRHQFHGTYMALLVLSFDTPRECAEAYTSTFKALGFEPGSTWTVLVFKGDSDALEPVKAALEPLRTDPPCQLFNCRHKPPKNPKRARPRPRHPIDAVAHSIDVGPCFELTLPDRPKHDPHKMTKHAEG